jgi:hypothetical protein
VLTRTPWTNVVSPDTFFAVVANLVIDAALFVTILLLARRWVTNVAIGLAIILTSLTFWQMSAVNFLSAVLMGIVAWASRRDNGRPA